MGLILAEIIGGDETFASETLNLNEDFLRRYPINVAEAVGLRPQKVGQPD